MSASDFCPHWTPTSTSTLAQDSEASPPRFNAYAGSFAQPGPERFVPYRNFNDYAVNHSTDSAPLPDHRTMQMSNLYERDQQQAFEYRPSYSAMYPHPAAQPPVPRRPVFSSIDAHPEVTWFGGAEQMPGVPSHPMMRDTSRPPQQYFHGNEMSFDFIPPVWPSAQEQGYGAIEQQMPTQYPPGPNSEIAPTRANTDPSRRLQPPTRRSSQQGARHHHGNGNRWPFDSAERRAFRALHGQGRLPDDSPPAATRRTYESFIQDMSRSITSSEAEEAAARVPPSFRSRRVPREQRMRHSGHSQYHDPSLATSRQVQGLKDGLPRRLLSQLPEGTSHTCDICTKDYSSTSVQASEKTEIAVELPCGHYFGEFCIFEWFDTCKTHKNKVTCPMCRKQLIEPESRFHSSLLFDAMYRTGEPALPGLLANELRAEFAHV